MKTQINLTPFTGTFNSIKLLAVTPTETKEVEIDPQQRCHMKDIRQFYVEMPSDAQRLDIQIDGQLNSVEINENTRRVIHVGICAPEATPKTELTAQQAMELEEAIERSGGAIICDEPDECPECGSSDFFESSPGYSQCHACGNVW